MRLALISVLVFAGCDFGMDFDFDVDSKTITVASSPGELRVTGCATGGILGCSGAPAGVEMSIGLDGVWKLVPAHMPAPLELFPSRQFEIVVPPPYDDYVGVSLAGRATDIEQLPWFDIEWPEVVDRGDGPVPFRFLVYPDAAIEATMTSQCPNGAHVRGIAANTIADGKFSVPVDDAALVGACTHEVRITQTLDDYDRKIAIIHVSRTEIATFTSTD